MGVLVTIKFPGNAATFRRALTERSDEFVKVSESARAGGARHHRFGIGDGFVVVADEWDSAEQFRQFFSNPDLQASSARSAPSPFRRRSPWPRPWTRPTSSDGFPRGGAAGLSPGQPLVLAGTPWLGATSSASKPSAFSR